MTTILTEARHLIGRRHKISRAEMAVLLARLHDRQLIELNNGWGGARRANKAAPTTEELANGWAACCDGICVISVLADSDPVIVRLASSNPGSIRYDEPGSMHPLLRATLMFAPTESRPQTASYLRGRCARLFLVASDGGQ